jgi:pyruvate/2-oxoglutarate dehydrogenase complex dihydrolipoamide dehydrogenase (E3) component
VATGGTPAAPKVPGSGLVFDTWDVLSGARRPSGRVLVYDDHGGTQALDAVEALVNHGAQVELVTPERGISPDVGGITSAGYFHELAKHGVTVTILRRLHAVTRSSEGLSAELGIDGLDFREHRTVDAIVAEMGTEPVTELYDELIPVSINHGAVDLAALLAGTSQDVVRNESGSFQLFRVGDAVTSRNVHAAILDAARLCRAI